MSRSFEQSALQHERARRSLAGGVATAFRSSQLPVPLCFERGHGARIWDIDGNEYVDYALAFGPLLLGHTPTAVTDAVKRQIDQGLGYGASHRLEAELGEAVCRTIPSAELTVFSTTGSEAVHAAVRIARASTGRMRIVKFLGHYDGWYDSIHVGVPPQRSSAPGTSGQDPAAVASVTVCPWNDTAALADALGDDVAAVIMEPLNVNGGCIPPVAGYLEAVREMTRANGTVLIFDEVITGYRLALAGAQGRYGVSPDLTILGKALGAGFPISAVCGSAEVMEVVSSGRMAHVGTFNANPVCASAALTTINLLEARQDEIYPALARSVDQLASILVEAADEGGLALRANHDVGVVCAFATDRRPEAYLDTLESDFALFRRFAEALLSEGVHVIPRGLMYLSSEHTDAELGETRAAIVRAAAAVAVREREETVA